MYHLKNMFINEPMSLVIPLTMFIFGTKLGELTSKQEKGVAKRTLNRKLNMNVNFVEMMWLV